MTASAQSLSSSQRVTPATVTSPPLDEDIVKVMGRAALLGGGLLRPRPLEQFFKRYMRKITLKRVRSAPRRPSGTVLTGLERGDCASPRVTHTSVTHMGDPSGRGRWIVYI